MSLPKLIALNLVPVICGFLLFRLGIFIDVLFILLSTGLMSLNRSCAQSRRQLLMYCAGLLLSTVCGKVLALWLYMTQVWDDDLGRFFGLCGLLVCAVLVIALSVDAYIRYGKEHT